MQFGRGIHPKTTHPRNGVKWYSVGCGCQHRCQIAADAEKNIGTMVENPWQNHVHVAIVTETSKCRFLMESLLQMHNVGDRYLHLVMYGITGLNVHYKSFWEKVDFPLMFIYHLTSFFKASKVVTVIRYVKQKYIIKNTYNMHNIYSRYTHIHSIYIYKLRKIW